MRKIGNFALTACVSAALAAAPFGIDIQDLSTLSASSAFAKDGNGGGSGNGGGNGGGGNGGGNGKGGGNGGGSGKSGGNGAGHGGGKSGDRATGKGAAAGHGKSGTAGARADTKQKKDPIASAFGKLFGKDDETKQKPRSTAEHKSKPAGKTAQTAKLKAQTDVAKLKTAPAAPTAAKLGSLNSLKRNYHAYMNSKSPRMAAMRAYVMAYAAFELENGVGAVPTDPALSDEALGAALLAAANKNINTAQPGEMAAVDPEVMAWAKDVLGVGPAVGKIDQVRDELAARQPTDVVDQPTEPEAEQPTDVVDQPTEPETEQPTDVVDQPIQPEPQPEQTAAVE